MIRVAVVEDQALTREVTLERLRASLGAGASVAAFASVEDLRAAGAEFDVVVLDLQIRGGVAQNAEAVRLVSRDAKVVVYSGQESAEIVAQARLAGALGYVSKDSAGSSEMLAIAVGEVLTGEHFVDPEMMARIGAAARRQLTLRQQEVLRLEALGRTTRQIARALSLSEAGVRRHLEHIVEIHPECAKQADRVRLALELGLVSPWEQYRPPEASET